MSTFLHDNLAALERIDPGLADRLSKTAPSRRLDARKARTGELVPVVEQAGKPAALHSLFDPLREAQRLRSSLLSPREDTPSADGAHGYLVFEGIGGGFHLREFLRSGRPLYCLVIECDRSLLRALLERIDVADLLSDQRVHLMVDPHPEEVQARVRSTYLPAIMGGLLSVPLRSRVDLDPGFFDGAARAVRAALEETADDYSTQASFGRVWTRNILSNLPLVARTSTPLPQAEEAVVTGAGPSLELQVPAIRRLRARSLLIATDASLTTLLLHGLTPDIVLAIDCQNVGYHHFLRGLPHDTILVAELAAPPTVTRLAGRLAAVSGGHPLSRLAAARVPGLLQIDTSGGNVGHSAVSLARELGASRVHLAGADFSYPRGKPYARGSFLLSYMEERQNRTQPLEGQTTGLMYRNLTLRRETFDSGYQYTTRALRAYRERFASRFDAQSVLPLPGASAPLDLASSTDATPSSLPASNASSGPQRKVAAVSQMDVKRFLSEYRAALLRLPDSLPPPAALGRSSEAAIDPWSAFASIYPFIARLRKESETNTDLQRLISVAKTAVVSMINRAIDQE